MDGFTEKETGIINQVNDVLEWMGRNPTLTVNEASKMYVCLAFEMFMLDLEERGFQIIQRADPEYFKDPLAKDMEADPQYKDIVVNILAKLIEIGFVKVKISNVAPSDLNEQDLLELEKIKKEDGTQ